MKYRLEDLLDIPRLQASLDNLYTSSKIPSALIDNDGKVHTASGWQDLCTRFHRVHPEARIRCVESDLYINRHIEEANPSIVYKCPHGLVDSATPILVEGEHLGNVFTGQLFLEEPDLDSFRSRARAYGFDEEEYIDAVKKVPIITEKSLRENLAFIADLTAMLAEVGLKHAREKDAERKLRESEERYRSLFCKAGDGIFIMSADGNLIEVNESFARMHGYTTEELSRMNIMDLDTPNTSKLAPERIRRLMEGETLGFEVEHYHKDGHVFPLEVIASLVSSGGNTYIQCFHRDISERKRAEEEKRKLEERLRQSAKMEAVGRLAGGIAHDFNNLLTAIIGYGELLDLHFREGDPSKRELGEIRKAADRAALLTRQLLAYSRQQILQPQVIGINHVVSEMDRMLRRLIGENIALETKLDDALWKVKADPGQISQVVMNLAINARDAMPRGGRLTIETSNELLDEAYCRDHEVVEPGPYVMLAVSDTGNGMTKETIAKIFDPFFTTKEKGKGTGLGLSTVYGIVKQSKGYIWAYSEPGNGSTFKIYLPRTKEGEQNPEKALSAAEDLGGDKTILLVEDDEAIRKLAGKVLEQYGYTVLPAGDGEEALRVAEKHGGEIHLLLTDVVMPGIGGSELSGRIRERKPGIKILYMSGYTGNAIVDRDVLASGAPFLQKPFSSVTLARKVKELLDG